MVSAINICYKLIVDVFMFQACLDAPHDRLCAAAYSLPSLVAHYELSWRLLSQAALSYGPRHKRHMDEGRHVSRPLHTNCSQGQEGAPDSEQDASVHAAREVSMVSSSVRHPPFNVGEACCDSF